MPIASKLELCTSKYRTPECFIIYIRHVSSFDIIIYKSLKLFLYRRAKINKLLFLKKCIGT